MTYLVRDLLASLPHFLYELLKFELAVERIVILSKEGEYLVGAQDKGRREGEAVVVEDGEGGGEGGLGSQEG
jgi:hypothetical protein